MNTTTVPTTPTAPTPKGKRGRTPGATSYLIVPLGALAKAGLSDTAPIVISRRWATEAKLNLGDAAVSADAGTAYRKAAIVPDIVVSAVNLGDESASAEAPSAAIVEDDAAPAGTETPVTP